MPTTTLKPKTTKGGSATKASLTNASAEKSRKMLEQMLSNKLSSSTKIPKTMTIKTGATKKSTASAGATKGRKGGGVGETPEEAAAREADERLRSQEEKIPVFPPENIKYGCKCTLDEIQQDEITVTGGYRKKMSSKKPMSAKLSKKSRSTKPKSAKK